MPSRRRNSNWFLVLLAGRRALTFLQQQPEVDPERLGVYGHSMGGRLSTEMCAIDKRVKAAVPSCGGSGVITETSKEMPLSPKSQLSEVALATDCTNAYLPLLSTPTLWLSPSNDFHGLLDNMAWNWRNIPDNVLGISIAPHLNHRHTREHSVTMLLWFEQYLKGAFTMPKTPEVTLNLKAADGIPAISVKPDTSLPVKGIDVYYSVDPHVLTRNWRDGKAVKVGETWKANCPVMSLEQPLYIYANVIYDTPEKYRKMAFPLGAGNSPTFAISSRPLLIGPSQLQAAGVQITDRPDRMIDDGSRGWHDWYQLEWANNHVWNATMRKLKDPKWRGPAGGKFTFDVKCPVNNTLVIIADLNQWGCFAGKPAGTYIAGKTLAASPDWQTVSVGLEEMMPANNNMPPTMTSWDTVTELSIRSRGTFLKDGQEVNFGDGTPGWAEPREFRNFRWEGGDYEGAQPVGVALSDEEHTKGFNDAIKKSLEQEKAARK